jgi:hypothetical protein
MNKETEILDKVEFILDYSNAIESTFLRNEITKLKESIEEYFLESYNAETEIRKILNNE